MVGAALSLMLALAWGGTHYPWTSARIITLLGGSAALWVLFALRLLTAREPFIPLVDTARPRHRVDHLRRVFLDRHHYRHHDLYAALLPDGARHFGKPVRLCADRLHGRHRGRFADRGAADGADHALHALADDRPARSSIAALAVLAIDPGGPFDRRGRGSAVRARLRARADVSDQHHRHAERRASRISWAPRPAR